MILEYLWFAQHALSSTTSSGNPHDLHSLSKKTLSQQLVTWPLQKKSFTDSPWCFSNPLIVSGEQKDVSENRGTPKSSILIGFSIINHPIWGTPIFLETPKNTHPISRPPRHRFQPTETPGTPGRWRGRWLNLVGSFQATHLKNMRSRQNGLIHLPQINRRG